MALERLTDSGERVTSARLNILAVLLASETALTHDDVLARLDGDGTAVDRVTVYRVLEWLVVHRLAHRIANESRIWRFGAVGREGEDHIHFECRTCDRVYCLESSNPDVDLHLPRGFKAEHAELKVQGECPACKSANAG